MNEYCMNLVAQITEKRNEKHGVMDLAECVRSEVFEMHCEQIVRIVNDIDAIMDAGVDTSVTTSWSVYYGDGDEDFHTYGVQLVLGMTAGLASWSICLTDEYGYETWLSLDATEAMYGDDADMYLHLYEDWDYILENVILVTRNIEDNATAEAYEEWRRWRRDRRALRKAIRCIGE